MGVQIATMKLQGQLVNKFLEVFPMKQYEIQISITYSKQELVEADSLEEAVRKKAKEISEKYASGDNFGNVVYIIVDASEKFPDGNTTNVRTMLSSFNDFSCDNIEIRTWKATEKKKKELPEECKNCPEKDSCECIAD